MRKQSTLCWNQKREEKNLPVSITETHTPPSIANRLRCFRKRQLTSQQEQGQAEKHIPNGSVLQDKQRILKIKLTLWPSHSCTAKLNIINTGLENGRCCRCVMQRKTYTSIDFFGGFFANAFVCVSPRPEISPSSFTWSYFCRVAETSLPFTDRCNSNKFSNSNVTFRSRIKKLWQWSYAAFWKSEPRENWTECITSFHDQNFHWIKKLLISFYKPLSKQSDNTKTNAGFQLWNKWRYCQH